MTDCKRGLGMKTGLPHCTTHGIYCKTFEADTIDILADPWYIKAIQDGTFRPIKRLKKNAEVQEEARSN